MPDCTTSRSIARASPTASSSRADGARSSSFPVDRLRRYGSITSARPLPSARGLSGSARVSRRRGSKLDFLSGGRFLGAFEQLDRMTRHDRRYGVLVDQLRVAVASQQHAEVIEPRDDALQFHAVHEKDREGDFCFANVIEEGVLQVLCAVACHGLRFRFLLARALRPARVLVMPRVPASCPPGTTWACALDGTLRCGASPT